jgi:6-pyruvoyl-tetrahydropterin synthase
MKKIKNFEEFLNEGSSSGYETAFGEDIIKDKKLFTHVINVLLDYVKNWESSDSVTKRKLEKWLKVYALENDDFDFLENLEHTMDGFFEYYDPTVINEGYPTSLSANPTAREIAKYIWDNWKKITGLKNSERNEEGHFPDEVEDILDKYGIDYEDFSNEWAYLGESSNFINEGSSPLLTVYLDKGLKMTYSAQDLMTYINDFNTREDDLPRWLYQATIKHSNYSYENPNVVMKSQFPKLVRMDNKNIRLLLELIVDYIIDIDNITKKLNKSRENVEINISRDQTPASWYIAPKWVANNTFLHESVEEINEGYPTTTPTWRANKPRVNKLVPEIQKILRNQMDFFGLFTVKNDQPYLKISDPTGSIRRQLDLTPIYNLLDAHRMGDEDLKIIFSSGENFANTIPD